MKYLYPLHHLPRIQHPRLFILFSCEWGLYIARIEHVFPSFSDDFSLAFTKTRQLKDELRIQIETMHLAVPLNVKHRRLQRFVEECQHVYGDRVGGESALIRLCGHGWREWHLILLGLRDEHGLVRHGRGGDERLVVHGLELQLRLSQELQLMFQVCLSCESQVLLC